MNVYSQIRSSVLMKTLQGFVMYLLQEIMEKMRDPLSVLYITQSNVHNIQFFYKTSFRLSVYSLRRVIKKYFITESLFL